MNHKKILIISSSFYPEISPRSFRTTELTKELSRQGHEVTIYIPIGDRNLRPFESEHKIKIKNIGKLNWKPIDIKGGALEQLLRRIFRRLLQMFLEWPDIELMFKVSKILETESGYDILISIAVPHPIHWGVAKARTTLNKIADLWIADCGDPFMGDTTDSFRKLFYFKYIEKWFCRKADFITIPFEGAKAGYYSEFHSKIRVIPQGFNLEDYVIPEYTKKSDYPIFAYAGGFIPGKRDPRPLLVFLSECNIKFKFIIYTSQKEFFFSLCQNLGEKVEIRDPIPRNELLYVLASMDFLMNFDNNTTTQLPSKLIDYSIADRPVLNIKSDNNFAGLIEFLDGDYSRKMNLDQPCNYDIRVVAKKFSSLQINL